MIRLNPLRAAAFASTWARGPCAAAPAAARWYSSDIDASKLTFQRTQNPKTKVPKEQLKFGSTTTDHMLVIDWDKETGWADPQVLPYGPFQLDPAASVLHYAFEAFEGLKAYVDDNGGVRLFRPDMNIKRLNRSCERLVFPSVHEEAFLECLKRFIAYEKDWIPQGNGYSLYIRPTIISTNPHVGVAPATSVKLYVILCPVGPYYASGFKPVRLMADRQYARAWVGGTGNNKLGGNYAIGIKPQVEAAKKGYSQMLWLSGDDLQVTEVGTMNQFFLWKRPGDGKVELITAGLEDGTILPGVTRDSVLQLCRQWGEFEVSEKHYTLPQVIDAIKEGRMLESFGSGTAAVVTPVEGFHFDGVDYDIPVDASDPNMIAGPLTKRIWKTLEGIQYGRIPHEWSVLVDQM